MVWSNNELWMLTGDHSGFIKYWQSNMNNVKMYQGHREAVRGVRYVCERIAKFRIANATYFICIVFILTLERARATKTLRVTSDNLPLQPYKIQFF